MSDDLNVAGMLPDGFVAGGLADDFSGTVREARYVSWDYNGSIPEPVLAARLKIERTDDPDLEGDDRFVIQHWPAGSLDFFVPSMDGKTPSTEVNPETGETVPAPGIYALRVGKRPELTNNTNWAQFLRALLDAQFPRDRFKPAINFIETMKGHYNRLPPDKKAGVIKNQTAEQREKASKRDVLVVTKFEGFEVGPTSTDSTTSRATAPGTSAPTASVSSASNGNGSLDARLATVVQRIVKVGAPAVKKTALSGTVLREMKGDKEVNAAVKRVTQTDFLESLAEFGILFDAEAGTVEAIATE